MTNKLTPAGLALIKKYEGFSAEPYQDVAGIWSIGYGHTDGVTADTHSIDESAAEELLKDDLEAAEQDIEDNITVDLTDNQFSALCSLVFNVGDAPLKMTLGHSCNLQTSNSL